MQLKFLTFVLTRLFSLGVFPRLCFLGSSGHPKDAVVARFSVTLFLQWVDRLCGMPGVTQLIGGKADTMVQTQNF